MERQLAQTRKLEASLQRAAPVHGSAPPIRSPIHQVLQLQGAVGLDRVQADAVLDFQQVVGNRGTGAILARQPKGPKHVSRLLWSARAALDTFVIAARSPRIFWHSEEIERDIWISWIAGLHGGGKSPDNPEAWSMEDMFKVHSALDEDAVEDHLHRIGVLGEGSRLGVSFGDFTSGSDTLGAYKEARKEERRLNLLGRIVVAINEIDPSLPTGVVRVRHDAYSLTGRPDPDPAAAEDYFRAISADGPIEGGELCEVTDTSTQMVVVKRPRGARGRTSVTAAESTKAGKIAGRRGAQ